MAKNQISLIISEDEVFRLYILFYKIDRRCHVSPALIGTVHAGRPSLAKCDTGQNNESGGGNPTLPSLSCQACQRHANASHARNNQERDMPRTAIGINMRKR